MEAYLEDNRPTIDEVCESYDECNKVGEPMKVREAIALLAYGTDYEIKGTYSGKIYHRSWTNKKEHAEKFYDETATDNPFYSTGRMSAVTGTTWFSPVIGIWMHDYYLCNKSQESEE